MTQTLMLVSSARRLSSRDRPEHHQANNRSPIYVYAEARRALIFVNYSLIASIQGSVWREEEDLVICNFSSIIGWE